MWKKTLIHHFLVPRDHYRAVTIDNGEFTGVYTGEVFIQYGRWNVTIKTPSLVTSDAVKNGFRIEGNCYKVKYVTHDKREPIVRSVYENQLCLPRNKGKNIIVAHQTLAEKYFKKMPEKWTAIVEKADKVE